MPEDSAPSFLCHVHLNHSPSLTHPVVGVVETLPPKRYIQFLTLDTCEWSLI